MARGRSRDGEHRPHSWAAFAPDDVEDARRGRPSGDLRDYAGNRGLAFDDRARCYHVLGLMPRWDAYVFNACRGLLGGSRHGVVAHELLELSFATTQAGGHVLGMGGTFHGEHLRGPRLRLRNVLPLVGELPSTTKDEPFPGMSAAVPVTTVAIHVPEAALLPAFTVRSADRLPSSGNPRLSAHGLPGYRLMSTGLGEDLAAAMFGGRTGTALRELDGPFVELRLSQATLRLQRNGFVTDPPTLDGLVERTGQVAAALTDLARPGAAPAPFADPLPPPPSTEPGDDADRWGETLDGAAKHFGLTREDPDALHRRYPALPVPGRSRGVLGGVLPGGMHGRVTVHQHRAGSFTLHPAALFPAAPGAAPTPPGGIHHEATDMLVGVCDDLVACWKRVPDHRELSVTGTVERGWRAATDLGLAAT